MTVIKHIFLAGPLLLAAAALTACNNEEEDIFDASPADRLNQAVEGYTDLLCSAPNGWVMQYFAANTNEGGYTFLMQFNHDTSVKIASNNRWTSNAYKEETSVYQILTDNGPVLSFNTFNKVFHVFSTPEDVSGTSDNEQGYGHNGDYEFVVMETTDTHIRLKGKKTSMTILMDMLPEGVDWQEYLQKLQDNASSWFNDTFDPLRLCLGDRVMVASGATSGVMSMYPEGGDALTESVVYPFIITENGIRFRSRVEGSELQSLTHLDDGTFVNDDNQQLSLTQMRNLAQIFADPNLKWTLTAENAFGKFADLIANLADETKSVLKRNFTAIDFMWSSKDNCFVLYYRHSNLQGATPYIYGEVEATANAEVKFNISTTEGNSYGVTRLNRLPSLVALIEGLNEAPLTTSAASVMAPTTMTLTSSTNPADYMVLTLKK